MHVETCETWKVYFHYLYYTQCQFLDFSHVHGYERYYLWELLSEVYTLYSFCNFLGPKSFSFFKSREGYAIAENKGEQSI